MRNLAASAPEVRPLEPCGLTGEACAPEDSPRLPGWLCAPNALPARAPGHRHRRGAGLLRTLEAASALIRAAMLDDAFARRDGWMQRLDPRARLAGIFLLVLATGLVHHLASLAGLFAVALAMSLGSRLPPAAWLGRLWLFACGWTALVTLPATLSWVTPGTPWVVLFRPSGGPIALTFDGMEVAGRVVARVAVSLALVLLVLRTTRWTRLLAGLRGLLLPEGVVLVLRMTHRYLLLLVAVLADLLTARRARTVAGSSHRHTRRALADAGGALFVKTLELAGEVHQAMIARGYRGEPASPRGPRLASRDVCWLAAAVGLALLAVLGDRAMGA